MIACTRFRRCFCAAGTRAACALASASVSALVLAAAALATTAPALAQRAGDQSRPAASAPADDDFLAPFVPGRRAAPMGVRPRRADEFAGMLFRPNPRDAGPLKPGEEDELLRFAEQRAPRMSRALRIFRDRNPEQFQRRLREAAPRLRALRRIFQHSPPLGELVRSHMEAMFELQRSIRMLRRLDAQSPAYAREEEHIREDIAATIELEIKALNILADELDRRTAERVDAWMRYLLEGDPNDPPMVPPAMRAHIAEYHAATTDSERTRIRGEFERRLERRMREETLQLRERAVQRRAHVEDEAGERLDRMMKGRWGPGPRDFRGPPGAGEPRDLPPIEPSEDEGGTDETEPPGEDPP